jgi:hypothetical protein
MGAYSVMTCRFFRLIPMLVLGVLVAGCITTAEQAAQRNEERCLARGYQPKTDAFSDCIVRLESERDARMESRRRDALEKSAAPPSNRGY